MDIYIYFLFLLFVSVMFWWIAMYFVVLFDSLFFVFSFFFCMEWNVSGDFCVCVCVCEQKSYAWMNNVNFWARRWDCPQHGRRRHFHWLCMLLPLVNNRLFVPFWMIESLYPSNGGSCFFFFFFMLILHNQSFERWGFPVLVDGCVVTIGWED